MQLVPRSLPPHKIPTNLDGMHFMKRTSLYALPALLGALLLTACSKPEEVKPVAHPVFVVTAHSAAASSDRVFPATIQARHESELSFRTGGKVVARLVSVGERVRSSQ